MLVARVGVSVAGGVISGPGSNTVTFLGSKVSLDGDAVTPHGTGLHAAPIVVATHNSTVTIGNILVIVNTDLATCSHQVSG
ncbi:MAG: hypothetical protein PHG08_00320 [Bacilli bacterium]|nr:hypothetical protein [Bacilli bacterium]